jgi:hypothetical protein
MVISLKLFLLVIFYLTGSLLSIPLGIAYSNNFIYSNVKGIISFCFLSWISCLFMAIEIKEEFPNPIKTKNKFQKYFQFRFVKRNYRGLRLSDEY